MTFSSLPDSKRQIQRPPLTSWHLEDKIAAHLFEFILIITHLSQYLEKKNSPKWTSLSPSASERTPRPEHCTFSPLLTQSPKTRTSPSLASQENIFLAGGGGRGEVTSRRNTPQRPRNIRTWWGSQESRFERFAKDAERENWRCSGIWLVLAASTGHGFKPVVEISFGFSRRFDPTLLPG